MPAPHASLQAAVILGVVTLLTSERAFAQVDCGLDGSECATTRYGLGLKPDFRTDEVPPDPFRYSAEFFGPDRGGVSYAVTRADVPASLGTCGPERQYAPLPGQLLLRERTDCVPSSEGPRCSAGARVGSDCHLPTWNEACAGPGTPLTCCVGPRSGTCLGRDACTGPGSPVACCSGVGTGACPPFQASVPNELECGPGGICEVEAGIGCRVEIALSDGGVTPAAQTSEFHRFSLVHGRTASNGDTYHLSSQVGLTLGGTSDAANPLCVDANIRRRPTTGTRYVLPAARGGDGVATYVRWDSAAGIPYAELDDFATSFRIHSDDSWGCCAPMDACRAMASGSCIFPAVFPPPPIPSYCTDAEDPVWKAASCWWGIRLGNEDNVQPDLIFAGGRETAFYTDPEFVLPGQLVGVCRGNRGVSCFQPGADAHCVRALNPYACCTGSGTGTCSEDCSGVDADPDLPGHQPDQCDLRTPGYRFGTGPCGRDEGNDSRAECCAGALYVFRGTPHARCSLITRVDYPGDSTADCGLPNYGVDHRDDADCDGDADFADLCPFHSEWDQDLDSDGDCGKGPGGSCRGDECECGDQAGSGLSSGTVELGDGRVNVSDLVGINSAIFGGFARKRLCDTTGDALCNVSDIVGAAREIFVPDSSRCPQITPRPCLSGVRSPCCGNGMLEAGEACDDGNLDGDDGCNRACRVESGSHCSGEPSECR